MSINTTIKSVYYTLFFNIACSFPSIAAWLGTNIAMLKYTHTLVLDHKHHSQPYWIIQWQMLEISLYTLGDI